MRTFSRVIPCHPLGFAEVAAEADGLFPALGVAPAPATPATPMPAARATAVPAATVRFRNLFVVVIPRTLFRVTGPIDPATYPTGGTAGCTDSDDPPRTVTSAPVDNCGRV